MAYLGNQPKDPISVSTNAPSNPKNGAVWFNSALGETFVYYDDGDTAQWVQTNPSGQQGPIGPTGPAGANGEVLRTELDAYLQVANSTSFATTSQLDNYLQVANASSVTPDQLSQYLQVANLSNLSTSLIPSANVTYDLGSTTKYWKDLYLSGNTIFLGSAQITLNANGGIDLPAGSRTGGTAIGTGTGSGGGASVTISDTAPGSPSAGDLWWSANTSELFIYYNDIDSNQWVQATTPGATGATGANGVSPSTDSYLQVANLQPQLDKYLQVANSTSFATTADIDFVKAYRYDDTLAINTGTKRLYIQDSYTLKSIHAFVDTAPTGSSVITNVKKNGSSLQNITIAAGATTASNTSLSYSFVSGDYITVDITQVGSSTAGVNLYIVFTFN